MKKISVFSMFLLICMQVSSQNNIVLNFSGDNNSQPVILDHVWIKNVTKSCDTALPAGVMSINLGPAAVNEYQNTVSDKISIKGVSSNPFADQAEITLFVPHKGLISVAVSDMSGRSNPVFSKNLERGIHRIRFSAGDPDLYVLTFSDGTTSVSVKLVSSGSHNCGTTLEIIETSGEPGVQLKSTLTKGFTFTPGDELMLVGYAGGLESGTIRKPNSVQNITFQFAHGIPCPGLSTVTYEGKTYNTVQIMTQCWLKENLDIGNMINGTVAQSDNQVIEKYCFNDDVSNCTLYGGLYQWSEMMNYISDSVSLQGLCPGDWHVATDLEWMVLEGTVDSQYGIGDPFWWHDGNRGYDAGKNLKSTSGWQNNGNGTDLYGFTALPGGIHHDDNTFIGKTKYACFWTSSRSISVFASHARLIDYYYNLIYRDQYERTDARSVRCIKNY
jgi:uncharacterized protein (TIGR02145 family)